MDFTTDELIAIAQLMYSLGNEFEKNESLMLDGTEYSSDDYNDCLLIAHKAEQLLKTR